MQSRGKRFESELRNSFTGAGMFVERIPDKVYWDGHRMRSDETPADFISFWAGDALSGFMVEAKATSQKRIPHDRLLPHQHDSLSRFDGYHQDSHGIVAVNFYDADNIRSFNRCFLIPISAWDEILSGKSKSISLADCENRSDIIECPRAKGSVYDMSGFLSMYN